MKFPQHFFIHSPFFSISSSQNSNITFTPLSPSILFLPSPFLTFVSNPPPPSKAYQPSCLPQPPPVPLIASQRPALPRWRFCVLVSRALQLCVCCPSFNSFFQLYSPPHGFPPLPRPPLNYNTSKRDFDLLPEYRNVTEMRGILPFFGGLHVALQTALNTLGYRTYHYTEIFKNRQDPQVEYWTEALKAKIYGNGRRYGRVEFDRLLWSYSVQFTLPFHFRSLVFFFHHG